MLQDPTFWVLIAFILFIAMIYRPLGRFMAKSLDARAARIERELAEAVRLREEAQALLASYQKKHRLIHQEAEAVLASARAETARIMTEGEETVRKAVEARIALAEAKIAQEEQKATQLLQKEVVDMAIASARRIISERLGGEADERMIGLAMENIPRIVH